MKISLIVGGLVVGAVLGLAGNFVPEGLSLKAAWGISGLGLIVAYVLLAAGYARKSQDEVAAGFVMMALGEAVLFSGLGYSVEDSQTSFAGGASIYFVALFLISLPGTFALWTRAAAAIAGVLFGVAALQIYAGQQVFASTIPHTSPLVGTAYGILTVAMIGWIIAVLRGERTVA